MVVQEGLFLYTRKVSPYDGGVFFQVRISSRMRKWVLKWASKLMFVLQAPLLLSLFSLFPSATFSLFTSILYIFLDLLGANALMQIAASGESGSPRLYTSPRKGMIWDSIAIGAA